MCRLRRGEIALLRREHQLPEREEVEKRKNELLDPASWPLVRTRCMWDSLVVKLKRKVPRSMKKSLVIKK